MDEVKITEPGEWETRSGHKAVVTEISEEAVTFPVKGMSNRVARSWTLAGQSFISKESPLDLIRPWKEPHPASEPATTVLVTKTADLEASPPIITGPGHYWTVGCGRATITGMSFSSVDGEKFHGTADGIAGPLQWRADGRVIGQLDGVHIIAPWEPAKPEPAGGPITGKASATDSGQEAFFPFKDGISPDLGGILRLEPKPPPYWLIYGLGRGAPTKRHPTLGAAEAEAARLAAEFPNTTFIVLAPISAFKGTVDVQKVAL